MRRDVPGKMLEERCIKISRVNKFVIPAMREQDYGGTPDSLQAL